MIIDLTEELTEYGPSSDCSICHGTGKDTECRAYATSCQCNVCLFGYYDCTCVTGIPRYI